MEVADKQPTSSKTVQEFHANFTSQTNSLNTSFINSVRPLITGQTLQNNSSASNSHAKFGQKIQTRAQVALFFVSNFNQAANEQECDRIASWKI